MNRAQRRAAALRKELGLRGRIDAEAVAARLGDVELAAHEVI